ncbi:MAG: hypothetical protein LUQ07_02390 [Methanospirillum sp.]|nr:hypothetical protein [Methanospirillum sp.]
MIPRSSGEDPRIRIDRLEIVISRSSPLPVREEIVVLNEGSGRLHGTISSSVPWVKILDNTLDTRFIQRISLEIHGYETSKELETDVVIVSSGGNAKVRVLVRPFPASVPLLYLDKKVYQFCRVIKGEVVSFSIPVKNRGEGFLSGTATPLSEWIEIPSRGIWTRDIQVIQVRLMTSRAPAAIYPVGRIRIRTNGGTETVEVSIHRSPEKGPAVQVSPSTLRISWVTKGIIEERIIIKNTGTGILRGTIPGKFRWINTVPSIFSVENTCRISLRVDTRQVSETIPASVTLDIITNVGVYPLHIEISRKNIQTVTLHSRIPVRQRPRSRMTVLSQDGSPLPLIYSGKSGGEGEIWYIDGDETSCVKIFRPHRSGKEMEHKLRTMQANPVPVPHHTGLCWPLGIVSTSDKKGRFLGYLMKRLDFSLWRPVHAWYDSAECDFGFSMDAAGRLAELVRVIHSSGHCIGDLRENNVFISNKGEICIIDTDSFQVTDPETFRTWYCRVGTGEYLPPELIEGSFEQQDIDRLFADRFALAVLIFRFLMQGAHPYQARGPLIEDAPTTMDKIRRGYFAYERKTPGILPPEYAPPYDRIPPQIRALFHETFVTGHHNPQLRPDPSRWAEVLGYSRVSGREVAGYGDPAYSGREIFPASHHLKPAYSDENRLSVEVGRRVFRIHHGEIRLTDRSGLQILFLADGLSPAPVCTLKRDILPPSVLVPGTVVYGPEGTSVAYGALIPKIDPGRYVHWHIAADGASRYARWKDRFSFRHRVAACRNLVSALVSATKNGLVPISLSYRSVFVAPDSSVRILATPDICSGPYTGRNQKILEDIRNLIVRMLMNGYSLSYCCKDKSGKLRRVIPPPEVLPYPLLKIVYGKSDDDPADLSGILQDWIMRCEQAFWSLCPCPSHPDHWFPVIPGWCPWCTPSGAWTVQLSTRAPIPLLDDGTRTDSGG